MPEYRESQTVEFKEKYSDTFLKSVSAFANFHDGEILFGVRDNGDLIGIENPDVFSLQIETKINDSIAPWPQFSIEQKKTDGRVIVCVKVRKGSDAPYLYKGVAYQRRHTASIPLDSAGLRSLSLSATPIEYDQQLSSEKKLSFRVLEVELQREIGLTKLTRDSLRSLGLLHENDYTIAGELFADENHNLKSATNIVRFGASISIFLERRDVSARSILTQYAAAIDMFRKWYAPYEEVEDGRRIEKVQIPFDAYRETVANALTHRRYDLSSAVRIAMYANRIEVTSPGGLPEGMSKNACLHGQRSVLRNVIVAEVLHRLRIIEKFGTGMTRIRSAYQPYPVQPALEIEDDALTVTLPVLHNGAALGGIPGSDRPY